MTATALPARDRRSGRFVALAPLSHCSGCGWIHAEALAGYLYCPNTRCETYRQPAGQVLDVDAGLLADMSSWRAIEPGSGDGHRT